MTYPTLSKNPSVEYTGTTQIDVLKSDVEGGYTITRARNTRKRKIFNINYKNLSKTDFDTLMNFYENDARAGANIFSWTEPLTNNIYDVRFDDELVWQYNYNDTYNISFKLKEV